MTRRTSHSDDPIDSLLSHATDRPVEISFNFNNYIKFLNALKNDNAFRQRLENDPIAGLGEFDIKIPHIDSARLEKFVRVKSLPAPSLVESHLIDLGKYHELEEEVLALHLLHQLTDESFRADFLEDPAGVLQKHGIEANDLPEEVSLPEKEEIEKALADPEIENLVFLASASLRYHFSLEWYLLTSGGRF